MVGYKDPPKEHQFKPGQSGNPRGKPKGSRDIKTILTELLQTEVAEENPLTGEMTILQAGELMYTQLVAKAAKDGDLQAIDKVMDRLEGKAVAKTEDVTERSFMDNLEAAKKTDK